ncbi:SRPBCC family protein [Tabrizicola sp.]|uniref:SRPBCC family protein n=1 Tax=Tabrizicola sp. TaxID=2005166 RepID=UPI003F2ED216
MKLTAKSDIEAPASFAYACLTDFSTWERDAVRRGVEVERPQDMPLTGPGAGWRLRFPFRGKLRKVLIRLEALTENSDVTFTMDSPAMEGDTVVEVLGLSPRRTRLRVAVTVKPKTLAARLFLNTLRLAKGRVQAKFEVRVQQLGAIIEDRYARSRAASVRV